jgi:prophage regulatory protein
MQDQRLLSAEDVRTRVGVSRTTIWREVRAGRFPAPVQISPRRIGFVEAEIDAFLARQRAGVRRSEAA